MAHEPDDAAVEQYSGLLEQVSAAPYQRDLHLKRIQLAKSLALGDEVEQARQALAGYLPLSEGEWLEWIEDRKQQLPQVPVEDVTPHLEVMELYRRASRDYLSIPLLISWSEWVVGQHYASKGLSPPLSAIGEDDEDAAMQAADRKVGEPDQLLEVVFSLEEVRGVCDEVLAVAGAHLAESSRVWKIWRDFEMDLLKTDPSPDQLVQVEQLYLERLKVPHLDIAETFSAYSSFVTTFDNDNYDKSLPAANKIYSATVKKADERYPEEEKLKAAGYSAQAYLDYVAWEREVKRPDTPLVKAIFERAVKDHPSDIEVWEAYLEFLHKIPEKESNLREVAEKAVRNLPSSVSLWTAYFRVVEKLQLGAEEVETLFQRAIATGFFDKDMGSTIALYHARASFYRREIDNKPTEDGPDADLVGFALGVLQEGIEATKKVQKKGDPQYGLEKYLIRLYERFHMVDEAREMWEELTKTRAHDYALWYARADFETRMGDYQRAHEVYTKGCSERSLNYPEYLLEAWLTFEAEYGNLADLEFALVKSKRQKKGLKRKRAREAAQAQAQASAAAAGTSASTQDADSFIADTVQSQDAAESSKKRERADEAEQGTKKVRIQSPAQEVKEPTRDREHSTVFAMGPTAMGEEDIRKLFRDCGEIRELHVKTLGDRSYAQIEFMDKESVLPAQTKDKKRINDEEVEVYIAWQSCLYVTNFPESFDKAAIEQLFSKYGTIFDTRWPSKRFKTSRRFCYVQFANPAHAQAALVLHGMELEPGHPLSVFVSDPSRKKNRTDANANSRELYIANLAKSVKDADLRKLFEPYGAIKDVRMPTDDKGLAKSFAFVEFEEEVSARAALALNNHELRKRHISVTIAEQRATGTKVGPPEKGVEKENRGVRVLGLDPSTQEAIIQQEFEKLAPVRRVNYIAGSTEAVVLLENPADVGKVLMQHDSMTVDGKKVELAAERPRQNRSGGSWPAQGTGDAPLVPRVTSRGRGRGRVALGGGRGGRGGQGGRLGLGAGRPAAAAAFTIAASGDTQMADASAAGSSKGQDAFRAMLQKKKDE
ncbi:Splicing factor [Rhodotorula toruloides]